MKKGLLIILAVLMFANIGYATTLISLPNTYSAGSKAKASEANANEQHIQTQVNTHNAATTGEHGITGTIVGTGTSPSFTGLTVTGDATWSTGTKIIFGNASRYLIDDTTVYGIESSTNVVIPQGAKIYLDGGGTRTNITSSSNSTFDIKDGSTLRMRIDDTGDTFIQGAYDDTTGSAANLYVGTTGQLSRSTSARKYKTNERPLPFDKTKLMGLKAILYNSKCAIDDKKKDFIGIVADDAIKFYPELVINGLDGQPEGFNYERLTVVLLKAIQEQQVKIDSLEKRIEKLEGK